MRKRDDTLRDTLITYAREMGLESGAEAINIRALAKKAGISVGTVYNYFESKDDILLALTEEYWHATMVDMRGAIQGESFVEQVREIYAFLRARMQRAGSELMASLRNVEMAGREKMQAMQAVLRGALMQRMEQDAAIRTDIWSETFTREQYADFILMNLTLLLRMDEPDMDFLLEMMRRTLY